MHVVSVRRQVNDGLNSAVPPESPQEINCPVSASTMKLQIFHNQANHNAAPLVLLPTGFGSMYLMGQATPPLCQ